MPDHHITKVLPPVDYLRSRLDYDPETGKLYWKHWHREHFSTKNAWAIWNSRFATKRAGTALGTKGYHVITIDRIPQLVHRVIWKLTTGNDPSVSIDHINNKRTDNRITNLRLATPTEQQWNRRLGKNNTSGLKGAFFVKRTDKWEGQIKIRRKQHYLGTFNTREEAAAAYEAAARKLHGRFYRPT
jgi:hypothetical protein